MRILLAFLLLAALAFSGCSGDDQDPATDNDPGTVPGGNQTTPPPAMAPMSHTVMLQNNQFDPADLTIHVGDTVTWHTMDVQMHNIVSSTPGQEFRSPDVSMVTIPTVRSDTYERTFTVAGHVDYLCEYHNGMVATLTILAANATA